MVCSQTHLHRCGSNPAPWILCSAVRTISQNPGPLVYWPISAQTNPLSVTRPGAVWKLWRETTLLALSVSLRNGFREIIFVLRLYVTLGHILNSFPFNLGGETSLFSCFNSIIHGIRLITLARKLRSEAKPSMSFTWNVCWIFEFALGLSVLHCFGGKLCQFRCY